MAGLGWVHEHRGRARRGECGGDLAADVAALAHAHYDHAAGAAEHGLHGAHEALALAGLQPEQRLRLYVESLVSELQCTLRIELKLGGHGAHRLSIRIHRL